MNAEITICGHLQANSREQLLLVGLDVAMQMKDFPGGFAFFEGVFGLPGCAIILLIEVLFGGLEKLEGIDKVSLVAVEEDEVVGVAFENSFNEVSTNAVLQVVGFGDLGDLLRRQEVVFDHFDESKRSAEEALLPLEGLGFDGGVLIDSAESI